MNAVTPVNAAGLDDAGLDLIFREARTFNRFLDQPVSDVTLAEVVRLAEFGPTAVNALPGRFLFLKSAEAKARIAPYMADGNREKTVAAPVVVIAAHDLSFPETLIRTFPHAPGAKDWFAAPGAAEMTASYSGALQTAYLIIAARALGLDAGPMGGFDRAGVDGEFFAGTSWRSNLVINLGYGDRGSLFPRNPRFEPAEISKVL